MAEVISKGIDGCNHTTRGQGCPEAQWSGVIRYIYTTTTVAILVMWRTQYGDRILEGAEAIVFAEALLNLLDEVTLCDFDDYELGIKCSDTLTYGQKIPVLATIGNGLFRKDVKPVELTAVLEAGIAGVFENLKNKIIIEIDEPELGTE